ncbi:response regulator [Flavitalea flava]
MTDRFMITDRFTIRVVIIEDDETIRDGYAFLINANPACTVVHTYASADQALPHLVADLPDVILLDVGLPGTSGVDALPGIRRLLPDTQVLILTVYESEELILKALANGASGYLTKNTPTEKIMEAIEEVMKGGGPMSANIARMVIGSFRKNQGSPLTKRETEILEYISNGISRSKIAKDPFIDLETVKTHIKNIYGKLNVHSRADAIREARLNRFIR